MSASDRQPRSPQQIARILVDAETFGISDAAEMHGIHRNSIRNLRTAWGRDPRVVRACAELREEASKGWIEKARAARGQLLGNVLKLAATTKSLRAATEALRRVGELVMASEILDPEEQAPPQGGDGGPDEETTEKPAETAGDTVPSKGRVKGGVVAEPHDAHQPPDARPPQGAAGRRRKGTRH